MATDLGARARSGASWSAVTVVGAAALSLFQLAVAARFLERGDFGTMALVLIVVGFCQSLSDLGTAGAVLHRQRATRAELTSLFWLSAGAGAVLGGAVAASGPVFAALWSAPELSRWLPWMGVAFLFGGVSQVHLALLRRELRFKSLAAIELMAMGVSVALVTALAVAGRGVAALVAGQLGAAALRFVLAWVFARGLFRPGFHFARAEVAPFVSFGAYQLGERLVNFASWNLDKIVVGAWLGTEALGAYSLAYQLMIRPFRMLTGVSSRVTRPLLARLQRDRDRLVAGYLTSVRLLAFVAFPLYIGAFLVSDAFVELVYGPGWSDVAALFALLWPLGILYAIGNPVGALVIATGRVRAGFLWNVFAAGVQLLAVLVGARFGVRGVAIAIVAATLFALFPGGFYLRWVLVGLRPAPFLACLGRPLLYASVMGLTVHVLSISLATSPSALQLALAVASGVLVYGGLVAVRERALWLSLRGS